MKSKSVILMSISVVLVYSFAVIFLGNPVSAQQDRRVRTMRSAFDETSTVANVQKKRTHRNLGAVLAAKRSGLNIESDKSGEDKPGFMDGTSYLIEKRNNSPKPTINASTSQGTIPFWSDSFDYHGLTYTYRMVGSDPKNGSKTTTIPTVLIPLRFVFPDGQVFDASTDLVDGQTPIRGIMNSPIFQSRDFVIGGTRVGSTQYADAFQRANFWDSVSGRSRNYHVLLSQPTALPTQTIVVPDGLGHYETDFFTGLPFPLVDIDFLSSQTESILLAANVTPEQLPIMVWGTVVSDPAFAWHGATSINGGPLQTFIGTSYKSQVFFGGTSPDVSSLAHEVIEWLDDPFTDNFTPGWNDGFESDSEQCDSRARAGDLLETADPAEAFDESVVALPGGAFTYHVVEGFFIDFYTRSNHSRSVNGQYSMFEIGAQYGVQTEPSSPCVGHIEPTNVRYFSIPGADETRALGNNNNGLVTGIYRDSAGSTHGFILSGNHYQSIDYPGATDTFAYQINDSAAVVGEYFDTFGGEHGYMLKNGQFIQLDFPGGLATSANGINRTGDIIGSYLDARFKLRSFLLRRGAYSQVNASFRILTLANAINSSGSIVGFESKFGDPPFSGFLLRSGNNSSITFPGANDVRPFGINDQNQVVGLFFNADGYGDGFVTIGGYPYEVRANTVSINNNNQIVGSVSFAPGLRYGFVATLPAVQSSHAANESASGQMSSR